MRNMIGSSLQNARLFMLTENVERADAILRRSAEDLVFTEELSSSDSISAHAIWARKLRLRALTGGGIMVAACARASRAEVTREGTKRWPWSARE